MQLNSIIEEVLESTMTNLDKAIKLTERVFSGIVDKGGVPYFEHCKRVCDIAVTKYNINEDERCAAYLHDVLEDTDITEDDLREYGFSERTIELVKKLTRPDGITYMDYIRGIANSGDEGLIYIKLSDNQDNSDPERINNLPESERSIVKRYNKARRILLEGLDNA